MLLWVARRSKSKEVTLWQTNGSFSVRTAATLGLSPMGQGDRMPAPAVRVKISIGQWKSVGRDADKEVEALVARGVAHETVKKELSHKEIKNEDMFPDT